MKIFTRNILQYSFKNKRYLVIVFILLSVFSASAQVPVIKGRVIDKDDKTGVPMANVYFKGSAAIVVADESGYFQIAKTSSGFTELVAGSLGYKTVTVKLPKSTTELLTIELSMDYVSLDGIEIKPGGVNPAHVLVKKIRDNRDKNDPDKFNSYYSQIYEQTFMFMSDPKAYKRKNIIWDDLQKGNIQKDDSTLLMPMYFSEQLSHYYSRIRPFPATELKKKIASHESGISILDNPATEEFTQGLSANINFYQNHINLLGRNFPSPIGEFAPVYYKLILLDSINAPTGKQYILLFKPRSQRELSFEGECLIDSSTYALVDIKAKLPLTTNINFINGFELHNSFQKVNEDEWFYNKKEITLSFQWQSSADTTKKRLNAVATRISYYRDVELNPADRPEVFSEKKPQQSSARKEDEFWEDLRTTTADSTQQDILQAIDNLNNTKTIKWVNVISNIAMNGYWEIGKFDLGPLTEFYRRNKIEDRRLTFSGRTGKRWNENYTIGGYLGYGFGDEKWKYGGDFQYKLPNSQYQVVGVSYWNDIRKIGFNENQSLILENMSTNGDENIVSTILRIKENDKLSQMQQLRLFHEKVWTKSFSSRVHLRTGRTYEGLYVPFVHEGETVDHYKQHAVNLNARFSFNQQVIEEFFHRIHVANKYPVINLNFEGGNYSFSGVDNFYGRIHATLRHNWFIGRGKIQYAVEAGTIFGDVPFPMLEIHRGNQTYGLDRYNFTLMNYMEFASDTYLNLYADYYMNGIITHRLPLIRRLDIREVVSVKAAVGSLRKGHNKVLELPAYTEELPLPYVEVGVGLTNIFRFFMIESVWRLTDTNKPDVSSWGIRARFHIDF